MKLNYKIIRFNRFHILLLSVLFLFACTSKKRGGVRVSSDNGKQLNTLGISSVSATESKAQFSFIKAESFYLQQEYDKALIMFDDVIHLKPNQAAAYYKKANCYEKKNEISSAIINANIAVEKSPKSEDYSVYLVSLYKKTDNLQQAIYTYQNLIDQTKNYRHCLAQADIFTLMASKDVNRRNSLIGRGDEAAIKEATILDQKIVKNYKSAILAMQNFEDKVGKREDVIKKKQEVFLFLKDYKGAFDEGEKLIKLMPRTIEYKFKQAEIISVYMNVNEAISYQRVVVAENPKSAKARLLLADFYKQNNQYMFFQRELNAVFSDPEVDLEQKVKLVNQMLNQSEVPESKVHALEMAKKIVEAHPNSPQSHSILGDAYYVNKNLKEARNSFMRTLALDNSKSQIWSVVLDLDEELNDLDSLESHAVKSLIAFPDNYEVYIKLGRLKIKKKEFPQALNILANGLKQVEGNQEKEYEFYLYLGKVNFELKRYLTCFEYYEKALEFNPNSPALINDYSMCLAEGHGDLNKAKLMMYRVVRLYPEEYDYLDTYGRILYRRGELLESLTYLEKAIKNNNGLTWEHAGDAAYMNKQIDKAVEYWKKAKLSGDASKLIDQKIYDKKIP